MRYIIFLVSLSLFSYLYAKPPIVINPRNPNDPERLPVSVTKNVLVVGGGLAGLSAALELAERGYSVTIKEKFLMGGKLFSKPVEIFKDKTFQVEHGFHAWFHNYYQFHDIRTRLNINKNFINWEKVNYYFQNYKPEEIYSKGPYPLNLIGIIERSPNMKLTDAIKSVLSLPDMVFYNYDTVFDRLDNISFHDWAIEKKVAKDFYDIIMDPALSVTLNDRSKLSAAEMLTYIQMYFLSSSDADHRETSTLNFYDSVIKPWTDRLTQLNVRILSNTTVQRFNVDVNSLSIIGTIDDNNIDKNNYDYIVVTSDVGSTQNIFSNSIEFYKDNDNIREMFAKPYDNHISKMKIAPPYKVIRLWFDKQLSTNVPNIIETPDFGPVNLVVVYTNLEKEYIDWAKETGGSVIEFHCYTWDKFFDPNVSDDQVWPLISKTVSKILPEIFDKEFKVLAYHVNSFQNFASFETGLHKYRPRVDTLNLKNVYLAGDWIRTDYVACLMEKAVSTGREAANEILLSDHVRQASLTVTNPKGPGI